MTVATITPLPSGKAVFSLNGVEHVFDSWQQASREADARRIRWVLERFPPTPFPVIELVPAGS